MNTQDQELGVAIWLASHTKLSAKQIHSLCPTVHEFKVILLQSKSCNLAIDPIDPIEEGILTQEDLDHMVEPARMMKRTIAKRYVPRICGIMCQARLYG